MSSCDGVYPNRRKAVLVAAALISTILLSAAGLPYHEYGFHHLKKLIATSMEGTVSSPHRKLLLPSNQVEEPTRIGGDIKVCSESDLVVNQGPSDPLPSGIPTYTVEIINACATGCDITRIHFSCGWFSSARLIDPSLFKRVGYDDCIVNEGKSLPNGQIISFQYANTFSYPLSVSTMKCF